ncbi:MAG TPA: phosphopantetheine-binding protein [Thermoanaerobaculia bacterium]|nr:phosphopantetheine-binding protein [Thermoanaerobaculia bacterium]
MMKPAFRSKLAEILSIAPDEITEATILGADEWDSVQVLDLLATMDESYGVTLSTGVIGASKTVGELQTRMRAAGADL